MEPQQRAKPSDALAYARLHGFTLNREPFGKRGSLIEVYRGASRLGYRKTWGGALNMMKRRVRAVS